VFVVDNVAPRRNEAVFGTKAVIGKQAGAVTVTGDDAKTFQAAIIEYTKDQPATKVRCFAVVYSLLIVISFYWHINACSIGVLAFRDFPRESGLTSLSWFPF